MRGRAKLKARLEQRGMEPSATIAGASFAVVRAPAPAPTAWAEATVRLSMRFTHGMRGKVCC